MREMTKMKENDENESKLSRKSMFVISVEYETYDTHSEEIKLIIITNFKVKDYYEMN